MRSFYRNALADRADEVTPRFVSLSHEEIRFVGNPHAGLPCLASISSHEGTKARRHEGKGSYCSRLSALPTRLAAWALAACLLISSTFTAQAKPPTREDLEPVLRTFQDGAAARDFPKVKSAMASVAFATMHNMAVSFKQHFPPASASDPFWEAYAHNSPIPFEKLTFLSIKEKDGKAFLLYAYAYAWPSRPDKTQKGFLKADFIRQKDAWKLLGAGLQVNDSLTAKYEAGDRSFLDDPQLAQFADTPAMPPEATPADYIGQIQWYNPKGKLVVTVNGIPNELTSMSGFQIIVGGLKKGENKILFHYDPDAKTAGQIAHGPESDLPKVRLHVFTGEKLTRDADRQLLLYHWSADTADHEETVRLDDQTLAGLPKPEMDY